MERPTFFVVANHFGSKGGDDPLFGQWQPAERSSEVKRHQQAREVQAFVDELLAADKNSRVAVLGDINDFQFSETVDILVGSGEALTDLPRTLPADGSTPTCTRATARCSTTSCCRRGSSGTPTPTTSCT